MNAKRKKRDPDETPNEKFKRIASNRVRKILKYLDLLENCSNTYTYEYNSDEVNKIFKEINTKVKQAKSSFQQKTTKKGFEL